MNNNIHPILYKFYLRLRDQLGAEMVHRRKRTSAMCIEVIFLCDGISVITGRLNTLSEAEKWGFWVMCRPQTKRGYTSYKGRKVYQLFLTPVHPKKRREMIKTITPLIATSSIAITA